MDKTDVMKLIEYLRNGLDQLEEQGSNLDDIRKQIEELSDKALAVMLVLSLTLSYNMPNTYKLTVIQGILDNSILDRHPKH